MALKSFGTYSFTQSHITQQSYNDNFGDVIVRTTRFPQMEGGYSDQGSERSPSEIGVVWFSYQMESTTRAGMQTFRNAISAVKKSGLQKLVRTWYDGTEVYTYAFINHIEMKEDLSGNNDLWQPVEIIFTIPYPFWLKDGNSILWDINNDWDIGEDWGPSTDVINATGLSTTDTITVSQSLHSVPVMIIVEIPAGEEAHGLVIERRNDSLVLLDQITYNDLLVAGENLEIDARTPRVLRNGLDAYTTLFSSLYPRWMNFDVGDNNIEVKMRQATDEANVWFIYQGEY